MSITLYTGVPRSGKSYRVVYELHKLLEESAKDPQKGMIILHNIDGLNIDDPDVIDVGPEMAGGLLRESMFRAFIENKRNGSTKKVLLIIDECQRYLPYKLTCVDTIYLFDYHGHHNMDIWLITQHNRKISPNILTLVEEEVRAVNPRVNVMPGKFAYKHLIGGEQYKKSYVPVSQDVFALYKSQQIGPPAKIRSYRHLVLLLIMVFSTCGFFYWAIFHGLGRSLDVQASEDYERYLEEKGHIPQQTAYNSQKTEVIYHPPAPRLNESETISASYERVPEPFFFPLPDFIDFRGNIVQYRENGHLRFDSIEEYRQKMKKNGISYFLAPSREVLIIYCAETGDQVYPGPRRNKWNPNAPK